MLLLNSCFIDFLAADNKSIPYYESFLSQYTLITVTALVSQLSLMPEAYEDTTEEKLDSDINSMIQELPEGAKNKRNMYESLCLVQGIDPSFHVQKNENRVFISKLFAEDAKKYALSSREMVLRGLNSSAFLNYFFLIENTLKNIYLQKCNPPKSFVKGSEIIDVCLVEVLDNMNGKDKFTETLFERSQIFIDITSLSNMWNLLNYIRNQLAHSNGFYNEKAIASFTKRLTKIISHYHDEEDMALPILMLSNEFDKYENQIKNEGYLIIDDVLENTIRNTSIFIMESLYISEQ